MGEQDTIREDALPLTLESLAEALAACGLSAGQTVLVHSSLSRLGWVAGGARTVIDALLQVLTPRGTLMMPTHTTDNTDPARWQNPPVPAHWVSIIRESMPIYDPAKTSTRGMGAVPELFRTFPGVKRSAHPITSFAAIGPNADELLSNAGTLERFFDHDSPIGKLYDLDGYVLLLGVTHANNTSLHLAEYRAEWGDKPYITEGVAMMVDGERRWVEYEMLQLSDDDFAQIGDAYEALHNIPRHRVGQGEARFMRQRPIVDFAVKWMNTHRKLR